MTGINAALARLPTVSHVRKGKHVIGCMTDLGSRDLERRTRELFTECLVSLGALPPGATFGTLSREEIERISQTVTFSSNLK